MPTNERLRDALNRSGISTDDIATKLDVDPKTVERWVTQGRAPYRKHRSRVAALLRETERYLWPEALDPQGAAAVDESELVKLYAHRNDVPHELWSRLLNSATARIDVLVYVGMFLTEDPAFVTGDGFAIELVGGAYGAYTRGGYMEGGNIQVSGSR